MRRGSPYVRRRRRALGAFGSWAWIETRVFLPAVVLTAFGLAAARLFSAAD